MLGKQYIKKVDYGDSVSVAGQESNLTFSRKHSRRGKLVLAALLISVIVAVVFIALYVYEITKRTHEEKRPKSCTSPDCVQISSGWVIFFFFNLKLFNLLKGDVRIARYILTL